MRRDFPREERGLALVVTLLVIVVLTVVVTAFMQSMGVERRTSKAYYNVLQAQEAAATGCSVAMSQIVRLKTQYPYHAVGYKPAGQTAAVPMFLGHQKFAEDPKAGTGASGEQALTSGLVDPTDPNAPPWTDLNVSSPTSGVFGWMGSKLTNGVVEPQPRLAAWVKILRDASLAEQPNPSLPNYNPVVARYAYWIEDETAKLDVGVAGNANAGGAFLRSNDGAAVTDLDLGALPLVDRKPLPVGPGSGPILQDIVSFRTTNPFFLVDRRVLNRMSPGNLAANVADELRFYATTFSLSDELAGTGKRRVNLNALVTNDDTAEVKAADIDDIGWVITGKHLIRDAHPGLDNAQHSGLFLDQPENPEGPLPGFGKRFYLGTSAAHEPIYIKKIAANIRDYFDTDQQPTVIDANGIVMGNAKPEAGWGISDTPPQAMGKEAIPYLQEHAWMGYIEAWQQTGNVVTATLQFHHYFELFNPSTKDYTAPAGAFLKVYDLPTWEAGTFPDVAPAEFELDLSGVTVPAGQVVVITTNDGADPPGLLPGGVTKIVRAPNPADATRMVGVQSDGTTSGSTRGFRLLARSSSITDYRTQFLFGSSAGVYGYLPALAIATTSNAKWDFTGSGHNIGSRTRYVYSSSLRGGDMPSRSGDPRSLNEQLAHLDYSSGGNNDQTRFFGNLQGHSDSGTANFPGTSTFGRAAISFVNTQAWPDPAPPLADSAATAFAVVRDAAATSIGELGHIYDPSRRVSTQANSNILYARGGGRTLKIGQADDLVPATSGSTSAGGPLEVTTWANAAWRLADLFSVEPITTTPVSPVSKSSERGKLNFNGVLRDDGMALRAALRQFAFLPSPEGDLNRSGKPLSDTEINALVTAVVDHVNLNGFFLERGQISQLPFFASAMAGGSSGTSASDRGREEIFRRMVELVTTRSNAFTVYVVGESMQTDPQGNVRVSGRSYRATTFQLEPMHAGAPLDLAQPADKVDGYNVRVVHEIEF
jgi:hypothetical protein